MGKRQKIEFFSKTIENIIKIKEKYSLSYTKLSEITKLSEKTLKRILNKKQIYTNYDIITLENKILNFILFQMEGISEEKLLLYLQSFKLGREKKLYITYILYIFNFIGKIYSPFNTLKDMFYVYNKNEKFLICSITFLCQKQILKLENNFLKRSSNFIKLKLGRRKSSRILNYCYSYYYKLKDYETCYKLIFHFKLSMHEKEDLIINLVTYHFSLKNYDKIFPVFLEYFKYLKTNNKRKSKTLRLFYLSVLTNYFFIKGYYIKGLVASYSLFNSFFLYTSEKNKKKLLKRLSIHSSHNKLFYFIVLLFLFQNNTYLQLGWYNQFLFFNRFLEKIIVYESKYKVYLYEDLYLFICRFGDSKSLKNLIDKINKIEDPNKELMLFKYYQKLYIFQNNKQILKILISKYKRKLEQNIPDNLTLNNFLERHIDSLLIMEDYTNALFYNLLFIFNDSFENNIFEGLLFLYLFFLLIINNNNVDFLNMTISSFLLKVKSDSLFFKYLSISNKNELFDKIFIFLKKFNLENTNKFEINKEPIKNIKKFKNIKLFDLLIQFYIYSDFLFSKLEKELKELYSQFLKCKNDSLQKINLFLNKNNKINHSDITNLDFLKNKKDVLKIYLEQNNYSLLNKFITIDSGIISKIKYLNEYIFYSKLYKKLIIEIHKRKTKKNKTFKNDRILFNKENLFFIFSNFSIISDFTKNYFSTYISWLNNKKKYIFENFKKINKNKNITEEFLNLTKKPLIFPFLRYSKAIIIYNNLKIQK